LKVLLVNKGGSAFRTRANARLASAVGEQGETEGTIQHLAERNDIRVVYFGRYLGEDIGCDAVVAPSATLALAADYGSYVQDASPEEQEAAWLADMQSLETVIGGDEVIGLLQVAGYSPTFSWIGNPKASTVQCSSVMYQGPQLKACEYFKIPRLIVNNDPRTYPKDQEMSFGWEYARPAALLDQCQLDRKIIVGGEHYLRRSVWARSESWAYQERRENTDKMSSVCIAHAHITDGCKQRGRDAAWANVLGDTLPSGLRVFGRGWENFSGYDPAVMVGEIKPSEVLDVFNCTTCCPCVAAAPGFYTGKVYVCESQGCIPILYGNGDDPYTWDPNGVFLPLNSPLRVCKPGDLARVVDETCKEKDALRETWHALCKPHFSLLDEMIDKLVAGKDWRSAEWFDRFGGYQRA
jgi:hypothetical protein